MAWPALNITCNRVKQSDAKANASLLWCTDNIFLQASFGLVSWPLFDLIVSRSEPLCSRICHRSGIAGYSLTSRASETHGGARTKIVQGTSTTQLHQQHLPSDISTTTLAIMSDQDKANAEHDANIEMWKVKKLIKRLEAARGNGTSMISLIIRK